MVWGAIISAGAQLASAKLGSSAASKQNKLSLSESQRNRDFQERMARNKHTYEVEDLKRAGLNPILSAQGSGGPVPTGSQAPIANEADSATKSSAAALAAALGKAQVANINMDTQKKQAERDATDTQGALNTMAYRTMEAELPGKASSSKAIEAQRKIDTDWNKSRKGRFFRAMDLMGNSLNPFSSTVNSAQSANR